MTRKSGSGWYALRFEVLRRDSFACRYCGQIAPNVTLEVDHVVEVAEGGLDELENLVTACRACNRGKEGLRMRAERRESRRRPAERTARRGTQPGTKTARVRDFLIAHPGASSAAVALALGEKADVVRNMRRRVLRRGEA